MTKAARQRAILDIVGSESVASQLELQQALAKRGFEAGQATLSRDIRELGLAKSGEGYVLPGGDIALEPALPPVSRLAREFVLSVQSAQNLVVVKTAIGSAQPVAAALDGEQWPEVVGTLAGDDAILIVTPDKKDAKTLEQRIRGLLAR